MDPAQNGGCLWQSDASGAGAGQSDHLADPRLGACRKRTCGGNGGGTVCAPGFQCPSGTAALSDCRGYGGNSGPAAKRSPGNAHGHCRTPVRQPFSRQTNGNDPAQRLPFLPLENHRQCAGGTHLSTAGIGGGRRTGCGAAHPFHPAVGDAAAHAHGVRTFARCRPCDHPNHDSCDGGARLCGIADPAFSLDCIGDSGIAAVSCGK